MSSRNETAGLVFSYEDGDPAGNTFPPCELCGLPTRHGAFFVHLAARPGVALFVSCIRCQVELACVVTREFWPRGLQPPEEDPPPENSSGGGSTC